MSQSRTSAFAAAADAPDTAPILLVRAYLSGGTRYWTSRAGTYGGQAYTELLKAGLSLGLGVDALGRALRGFGRLELANESDGGATRTSDLLATDIVSARAVQIDWLYVGLTHPTDTLRLFSGMLEVPEQDCFDDQVLRLNLMDDGNPLWAGIQDLACARIHKILGTKITRTNWPGADPDVLGAIEPLLYGLVTETRCLPVDAGGMDVLKSDVAIGAGTVYLSDADLLAMFPASGTAVINDDEFTYTGKNPGAVALTGCSGIGVAHPAGSVCYEKQAEYVYLVAGHVCKSVTNVRVDGVSKTLGTDYTLDTGTGKTLIKFNAKPKAPAGVIQPVFSATVTGEQSPGTIVVTAEQSPGAIGITAEHGHSTDTGSHAHSSIQVRHEYASSPSLPQYNVSSQTTFSFGNTPYTGYTCNWHIKVQAVSGTWQWRTSGGSTVATLAQGENYFTEAATPGRSYILYPSVAGSISIDMVERDVVVLSGTESGAATGVAASRSGNTAADMAALSGSTAANMGSLAGSTAVSLSQVTQAAVSLADQFIGLEVVCDAEGYADDGSGTYTGTPNALIVNPQDQLKHVLSVQLGLTLADWVDTASWAAARSAWAAAAVRCDWGLYQQIYSAELFERFRWSTCARLFQGAAGRFKLHVLPLVGSSQKTITEAGDVLSPESGGGSIRVGRTALADLYNQVYVLYDKYITGRGYAGYVTAADATSQTNYRMVRTLIVENDFVRDATAAQWVANTYLAWHKDQRWRATVPVPASPVLHLEPCDKVSLTAPRMPGGGWTAKPFWIESLALDLLPDGQESRAMLICREA